MPASLECPECGAPLARADAACAYCGRPGARSAEPEAAPSGRFGRRGRGYLTFGLTLMVGLYALGWAFEDLRYWLDERAMAVWTGALPFAAFVWTAGWDPRWGAVWLGLGAAAALFAVHLGLCVGLRGAFQDDLAGIAALIAGAFLGGLGLHRALEASRSRVTSAK